MEKKRVSVLAIGNELLLGQIINKNAAQISAKILDYHLRASYHLVVGDEISEITAALNYIWNRSDIIFVTGGLGPTEDDLTREAIAQFMKVPLNQDENVLKELKIKTQKRGVQFTLNHMKQAQFPTGSTVMRSDVGTADGFHMQSLGKDIFVLPGPWIEIESCWENYIHDKLIGISKSRIQIEKFQILGLPESEISSRVQAILMGSPFTAEYRIHTPYVEVRVDIPPAHKNNWSEYDKKLSDEFSIHLIGKGNVDKALEFVEKVKDKKVLFVDAASNGHIGERLLPIIKGLNFDFYQIASLPASYAAQNYEIFFEVHPINESEWMGTINTEIDIPLKKISKRNLRPDVETKELAELFFCRLVEQL